MDDFFKKNSDEVIKKIEELDKADEISKKIIEEIVDEDLLELNYSTLEYRIKAVFSNINLNNLDENEFRDILIEAYYKSLPMGYCYRFWKKKKILLKDKYNIDWITPEEENPATIFD